MCPSGPRGQASSTVTPATACHKQCCKAAGLLNTNQQCKFHDFSQTCLQQQAQATSMLLEPAPAPGMAESSVRSLFALKSCSSAGDSQHGASLGLCPAMQLQYGTFCKHVCTWPLSAHGRATSNGGRQPNLKEGMSPPQRQPNCTVHEQGGGLAPLFSGHLLPNQERSSRCRAPQAGQHAEQLRRAAAVKPVDRIPDRD
jgi:hypothetical protein